MSNAPIHFYTYLLLFYSFRITRFCSNQYKVKAKRMWPCPKRSPSAGKLILSEASYSLVGLCCSVSLTPAYSYLLRCLYIKVKPGLSKECIPLVEY